MTTPGPGAPFYYRAELERTRRDWTLERLTRRANIGRVTYSRLLTQPSPPQAKTVKKLCDILGIPLAEGLELAGRTEQADIMRGGRE